MSRALLVAVALLATAPASPAAEVAPRDLRTKLPLVVLNAQEPIVDDPKVAVRVRVIDHGRANTTTRRANAYDGWGGIETRGHSSQQFPKKSYGLELRTRGGRKRDVGLLGMPADDDWVLYAAYNDKALMRNGLGYDAARLMGRWAPRTRFVEVVLNGRYEGVYVLTQKPELGRGRVRLPKAFPQPTLLEFTFFLQLRERDPHFNTPVLQRPVVWKEPKRHEMSDARARRVESAVGRVERTLYSGERGGWKRALQPGPALDYVLVQELLRNADAFQVSMFMVMPRRGRLHLGPVWDFDQTTGNSSTGDSRLVSGWLTAARPWASRLHHDPTFRSALRARWRAHRRAGFRRALLAALERHRNGVRPAVARNFTRWPVLDELVWPNPQALGSWPAEVDFLRGWLVGRMNWMDRAAGVARK